MKAIFTAAEIYWYIASDNYEKYVESIDAKYAVVSVLFEALAVEAYINSIGDEYLGSSYFKEHLDELKPLNKIIVVTKLVSGKDFPKGGEVYCKLKELFTVRNKLVHSKSIKIEVETTPAEISRQIDSVFGYYRGKGNTDFRTIHQVAENVHGLNLLFRSELTDLLR